MFGEISPRKKARAPFISIEEALEETRRGHMIIMMDDEQRENEGDLCMAAEKATPEAINFMAKFGRGLICLPMSAERIDRLGLSMMVGDNQAPLGTAFTTAITAKRCLGSGISAQDRAITILQAVREDATGSEFITPGYVYPLRAPFAGTVNVPRCAPFDHSSFCRDGRRVYSKAVAPRMHACREDPNGHPAPSLRPA